MQITYQKVLVPLPLRDYAESYQGAGDPLVHVWVNIPRALLQKRDELDAEFALLYARAQETPDQVERKELEDYKLRSHAWYSELWSQGPEGTGWPVEDILALEENDPMLLGWLADRTRELLRTRRADQKKV